MKFLDSQFQESTRVGGAAEVKRMRTKTGIADAYQNHFIDRLFALSTKRGRSKQQKEADIAAELDKFPNNTASPIWRIEGELPYRHDKLSMVQSHTDFETSQDFDPHTDTPVEILHVILLGFVKYFWRDVIARLNDSDKEILAARLSSFDTSGLGIPPLAGQTLVKYAGSLTGRDFRAIAQAAPFVLHGLKLKNVNESDAFQVWTALSVVIPLVWQPSIDDVPSYIVRPIHFLCC